MERPCGTAPRPTRERSDGGGSPWVVIVLEGDRGMQWSIPEGRSLGGAQVFWNRSENDLERFLSSICFENREKLGELGLDCRLEGMWKFKSS